MRTRALQCLLFACFFAGLGTSAQAQERSIRSYAQRINERVTDHKAWRPSQRATNQVSASRYRGSYGRARTTRSNYGKSSIWVPGHFENVAYQVFIPERFEKVWIPAVYETRYRQCGTPYQVLVAHGHWKRVCHPAHYETRYKKTWIAGRYETSRRGAVCKL